MKPQKLGSEGGYLKSQHKKTILYFEGTETFSEMPQEKSHKP